MKLYLLFRDYEFPLGVFSSLRLCIDAAKKHYIDDFIGIREVTKTKVRGNSIIVYDEDNFENEYIFQLITLDTILE